MDIQKKKIKFSLIFLAVVLALLLQIKLKGMLNFAPNFVLAVLIVAAFFADFLEILFLLLFSVLFLNWQPKISLEIILMLALPLIIFGARKVFPWQSWFAVIFAICSAFLLFNLLISLGFIIENYSLFLRDILMSLSFGMLIFEGLSLQREHFK